MRRIVHLSDLHFGRIDEAKVEPLIKTIASLGPDLVVVSGDLTQRARTRQFIAARAFLDALPAPRIVVPGNHDIPLRSVMNRFLWPLEKFHRYITTDSMPFYSDDEIAVLGINTARSLTIKRGRVNRAQIDSASSKLSGLGPGITRIVATHHPFEVAEGIDPNQVVRRSDIAVRELTKAGADLFLAGHLHIGDEGRTTLRYNVSGHSALIVQAGTAISTRVRGEGNSFNLVRVDRPLTTIERFRWDAEKGGFDVAGMKEYAHTEEGWAAA